MSKNKPADLFRVVDVFGNVKGDFSSKASAKKVRDQLNGERGKHWVSKGPSHRLYRG